MNLHIGEMEDGHYISLEGIYMMVQYIWDNIRALLQEDFAVDDLISLCYDSLDFQPAYGLLTLNTDQESLIEKLIAYSKEQSKTKHLLDLTENLNPSAFENHKPYIDIDINAEPIEALPKKSDCPYPGMVPFSEENAHHFFGREGEIAALLQKLEEQNFLFVLGPSGSGKSSLIFAGLITELKKRYPDYWLIKSIRLGSKPLQTFLATFGNDLDYTNHTSPLHQSNVDYWTRLVHAMLLRNNPAQRLLLIIDQFEDLFTQASQADQTLFCKIITVLCRVRYCTLLPVMRTDFYSDLMNSDLWPIDYGDRLEVAPLRGESLRQAITKPAIGLNVYIRQDLQERLVIDAADEPGTLPLVQETMVRLWEKMQGNILTLNDYEKKGNGEAGGLAIALISKADSVVDKLSDEKQDIAKRIFLRLVQLGKGRADTRCRQPIENLRAATDDQGHFEQTLTHLTQNRLLTLSAEQRGGQRQVDIAHEALIQHWPRLRFWIEENREMMRVHDLLTKAAVDWQQNGYHDDYLYRGARLVQAEEWAQLYGFALNELEYDFLEASKRSSKEQDRLNTLYHIIRKLSFILDLDQVLRETLRLMHRSIKMSYGAILLHDLPTNTLICHAEIGDGNSWKKRNEHLSPYSISMKRGRKILERGQVIRVGDLDNDTEWLPQRKVLDCRSGVAAPLISDSEPIGLMLLFHHDIDYFVDDHIGLIEATIPLISTAIDNACLHGYFIEQSTRFEAEATKNQAIVEGIANGVMIIDADNRIQSVNTPALHILKANKNDYSGRYLQDLRTPEPETIDERIINDLAKTILNAETRNQQIISNPYLTFRTQKDKQVVEATLSTIKPSTEGLSNTLVVLRDVSYETELERLRSELISNVAFALRTPMTSIKGYIDLLAADCVDSPETQKEFIRIVKANSDRIADLIMNYMIMMEIGSNLVEITPQVVHVETLIKEAISNVHNQIREKKLTCKVQIPHKLNPIKVDSNRVAQILNQLIDNAIKYTQPYDNILITLTSHGAWIQINIQDTGYGISEAELSQVFDRFYQGQQHKSGLLEYGTGLGLSIVKALVERLGGTVWVASKLGEGSTFSFTLPKNK